MQNESLRHRYFLIPGKGGSFKTNPTDDTKKLPPAAVSPKPHHSRLSNAPHRIRTYNLRFRRPIPLDSNTNDKQDLSQSAEKGAALGAAIVQESSPFASDLITVIDAWMNLPEPIKAGILAMVQAARQRI